MNADRSSEERSRFEKELARFATWAGPRGYNLSMWGDEYSDDKTDDAFSIWRAALEDRQEAAPEDCARYKHALEVIGCNSRDEKSANAAVLALYPASGGVPSEATPSKENAPKIDEERVK